MDILSVLSSVSFCRPPAGPSYLPLLWLIRDLRVAITEMTSSITCHSDGSQQRSMNQPFLEYGGGRWRLLDNSPTHDHGSGFNCVCACLSLLFISSMLFNTSPYFKHRNGPNHYHRPSVELITIFLFLCRFQSLSSDCVSGPCVRKAGQALTSQRI